MHRRECAAAVRVTRPPLLYAAVLVTLVLATATAATACGGGGPSIDERNAEARPAVSYEGGAALVEALDRSGFPCPEHTITPATRDALGIVVQMESVRCTYSTNDFVDVELAGPSPLERVGFDSYVEAAERLSAKVNSKVMYLEGELWFAAAGVAQSRLFDLQKALGGRLVGPLVMASP
jgi:hypothetical protein